MRSGAVPYGHQRLSSSSVTMRWLIPRASRVVRKSERRDFVLSQLFDSNIEMKVFGSPTGSELSAGYAVAGKERLRL